MIYIDNPSMDPYYNFGLEQYLMKDWAPGDEVFLFWRTEPTLMIGNYQNASAEINEAYARQKGIHVVRRISGGGTIYTDPGGWQFSFIVRAPGGAAIDFRRYAEPIVRALRSLGADAAFNDRNDILIDGKKISGNAQYHCGGVVLHHGSLLFDTDLEELVRSITVSDEKLVAKGIRSVRQRVANIRPHLREDMTSLQFKDAMLDALLGECDSRYTLTSADIAKARAHADGLRSWEWNYGREPRLSTVKGERFAGGRVDVHLDVDKGRITGCRITGDFFCRVDIAQIEKALVGRRLCRDELLQALDALSESSGGELIHRVENEQLASLISN